MTDTNTVDFKTINQRALYKIKGSPVEVVDCRFKEEEIFASLGPFYITSDGQIVHQNLQVADFRRLGLLEDGEVFIDSVDSIPEACYDDELTLGKFRKLTRHLSDKTEINIGHRVSVVIVSTRSVNNYDKTRLCLHQYGGSERLLELIDDGHQILFTDCTLESSLCYCLVALEDVGELIKSGFVDKQYGQSVGVEVTEKPIQSTDATMRVSVSLPKHFIDKYAIERKTTRDHKTAIVPADVLNKYGTKYLK